MILIPFLVFRSLSREENIFKPTDSGIFLLYRFILKIPIWESDIIEKTMNESIHSSMREYNGTYNINILKSFPKKAFSLFRAKFNIPVFFFKSFIVFLAIPFVLLYIFCRIIRFIVHLNYRRLQIITSYIMLYGSIMFFISILPISDFFGFFSNLFYPIRSMNKEIMGSFHNVIERKDLYNEYISNFSDNARAINESICKMISIIDDTYSVFVRNSETIIDIVTNSIFASVHNINTLIAEQYDKYQVDYIPMSVGRIYRLIEIAHHINPIISNMTRSYLMFRFRSDKWLSGILSYSNDNYWNQNANFSLKWVDWWLEKLSMPYFDHNVFTEVKDDFLQYHRAVDRNSPTLILIFCLVGILFVLFSLASIRMSQISLNNSQNKWIGFFIFIIGIIGCTISMFSFLLSSSIIVSIDNCLQDVLIRYPNLFEAKNISVVTSGRSLIVKIPKINANSTHLFPILRSIIERNFTLWDLTKIVYDTQSIPIYEELFSYLIHSPFAPLFYQLDQIIHNLNMTFPKYVVNDMKKPLGFFFSFCKELIDLNESISSFSDGEFTNQIQNELRSISNDYNQINDLFNSLKRVFFDDIMCHSASFKENLTIIQRGIIQSGIMISQIPYKVSPNVEKILSSIDISPISSAFAILWNMFVFNPLYILCSVSTGLLFFGFGFFVTYLYPKDYRPSWNLPF